MDRKSRPKGKGKKKPVHDDLLEPRNHIATEPPSALAGLNPPAPDPADFPIVGIGASAGGLAAFEAFFSGLPADSEPGMAFVLVQHLAPDHKSLLTELLRHYTRLQVLEVEDGMEIHPNCAYIIPPGRDMACLNGTLHLLEPAAPRGQWLPIDFFFRSLAQDRRERAIAVVLSGAGSDGSAGIRAIKGEGGMVIAQDPSSTDHDGMPQSAISTGLVDYVLPPAKMAAQIAAYLARSSGLVHSPAGPLPVLPSADESAMKKIFILLRSQTGHDFSQYKPSTVHRRIQRRMAVQQIESLESYLKFIQQAPAEVEALFRDLLIGVTSFFRDPDAFEALSKEVIPKLFASKARDGVVRVWVPGCATGEEAYSIAILLAERQQALHRNYRIQVFATDIDGRAIATARAGLYPASIASDISPERLARYFSVEPDGLTLRIHKSIRDLLVFSEQDVIKDPPFSKLDLISCRNLLIYLGSELQKKLIPLFHYALSPDGFLLLGTSESVSDFGDLFTILNRKLKIYQRKEELRGVVRGLPGRLLPPLWNSVADVPVKGGPPALASRLRLKDIAEQALLQQAVPAAALVTAGGDILYLHGRTGMYLEPSPGEAGVSNILRMAREGLKRDLATALHKAAATQEMVLCPRLRIRTNGDFTTASLRVCPVSCPTPAGEEQLLYLVLIEPEREASSELSLPPVEGLPAAGVDADARISGLLEDLRAKEESLQSASEQLETANEELRSSNEEMQSVNEELQSTNEELETSKEELQSVNEELSTVNAELQAKVADLTRANNDMNNLLAGTGIATVFVDHAQRILRFTPAATRIINLIQGDVGRPVGHLVSNLEGYDRLSADTQAVLDTLISREVEVRTKAGVWYAMRILPYRTLENVIEGAVITFIDINNLKRAQDALEWSEERFRMAAEGSMDDVDWLDLEKGCYTFLSPSQVALTGFSAEELRNYPAEEARSRVHPDDREDYDLQLQRIAAGESHPETVEYRWQVKSGEYRWFSHRRRAIRKDGRIVALLGVSRDITDRKRAEDALAASERLWRSVAESLPSGVACFVEPGMAVRWVGGGAERWPLPALESGGEWSLEELFQENAAEVRQSVSDAFQGAAREFELSAAGGRRRCRVVPLSGPDGAVSRVLVLAETIM